MASNNAGTKYGPGIFSIRFNASSTVDAKADVDRLIELGGQDQAVLAHADSMVIRVTVTRNSSAALTIDSLKISRDGSNELVQQNLTDTVITTTGEYQVAVTAPIIGATHLRLVTKSETLSSTNKFTTANFELICRVMHSIPNLR